MKIHGFIVVVSMALSCCNAKEKQKGEITEIAVEELRRNEIMHDSLTEKQLADIEAIQRAFSEVISSSLEETIDNFKRDQNPDGEIAIWLKMAYAYERFCKGGGNQITLDKKNEAFELIVLRSMVSEEEVYERAKTKFLSVDEIKDLLGYYDAPAVPMKIEKKEQHLDLQSQTTLGEYALELSVRTFNPGSAKCLIGETLNSKL